MKNIHYILFVLSFSFKAIFDGIFVARKIDMPIDDIKFVFMVLGIGALALDYGYRIKNNKNSKRLFYSEFKNLCCIVITFAFISLIAMLISGKYSMETGKELFYLFMPMIYAFLLLNTISIRELDKYFNSLLLIYLAGYYFEIADKINLQGFSSINYINSYSPFESSLMSGPAISLFLYFLYRKDVKRTIVSIVFIFMTFKRFAILFSILILILYITVNLRKKVSRRSIIILKIFFIVIPILTYIFMRPEYIVKINEIFNIDLDKFLMGRATLFNSVLDSGFISFGYASTTVVVGQIDRLAGHIHLDLIKIFMETSIIGLVIFVNNMWDVAGRYRYSVLVILYSMFNLLTSHSLRGTFSWLMIYLIIGVVSIENNNKEERRIWRTKMN